VALELTWSDPVTSLITARTDVVVTAGNGAANEVTSFLNGPARGGNLKLVATNVDPAVTVTLDWQVSQTSHIYEHEQAGQTAYPGTAPNGFTNPPGISGTGVLARVHSSLAAGNSASFLCALHGGDALLTLDDAGLGSPVQVALSDAAGFASGTVSGEFLSMQATAGTGEAMLITLPFTPMLLTVSNTGTVGPISPRAALLAQNH
jgi:hypothetical protein